MSQPAAPRCPDCSAGLPPMAISCPTCGLPLTGPAAAELWWVDQQLSGLTARRHVLLQALRTAPEDGPGVRWPARSAGSWPAAAGSAGSWPPPAGSAGSWPPPAAAGLGRGAPGTGGQQLLLGLGVAVLLIAATVFLAVAWNRIGVGGQVTVMAALTGAAAGASGVAARRRLPSAAEALAALACGLGAVDAAAAHALDLAGLAAVTGASYAAAAGAVLAGLCALAASQSQLRTWPAAAVLFAAIVPAAVLSATDAGRAAVAVTCVGVGTVSVAARSWLVRPARGLSGVLGALYAAVGVAAALSAVHEPSQGGAGGLAVSAATLGAVVTAAMLLARRGPGPSAWVWRAVGGAVAAAAAVLAADHGATPALAAVTVLGAAGVAAVVAPRGPGANRELLTVGAAVGGLALLCTVAAALAAVDGPDLPAARNGAAACALALLAAAGCAALTAARWPASRSGSALAALLTAAGAACFAVRAAQLRVLVPPEGRFGRLGDALSGGPEAVALTAVALAGLGWAAARRGRVEEATLGAGAAALTAGALLVAWDLPLLFAGLAACCGVAALGYAVLPGRGRVAVVGVAALSAASWVLLHRAGVTVVEAYTAPVAALTLLVGLVRLHREPSAPSWATVGPACSAALLPSALVAAAQPGPSVVRPALVLALAAAVCAAGVVVRWQSPAVTGAAAVLVVAVGQLAPVAVGLPHWVSLAVVGAALLAVGVRYEQRLADARRATRWLRSMH